MRQGIGRDLPSRALFLLWQRCDKGSWPAMLSNRKLSSTQNMIDEANNEIHEVLGHPQEVARNQELHPSTRVQEVTLTHVDDKGQAVMVNVGHKEQSRRSATASARVLLGERVYGLVTANMITKGNVQEVARLAGIMAAKQTSNLIPLCHNIPLSVVDVDFCMDSREWSMVVKARAETTAQTGVEMEAMVAATIASLTVYDMVKGVDKSVYISDVQLDEKSGGKSGTYKRSAAIVPETSHN